MIECVLRLDLLAARADGDDQLDLVVGLLGPRGIGKRAPVLEDRIGRLLKENGGSRSSAPAVSRMWSK